MGRRHSENSGVAAWEAVAMCSLRQGVGGGGAYALNPALLLVRPQSSHKLPWTPMPAIGRHGHRMQDTHHLYKPFILFLYWVYTNLQDTNAELTGILQYLYLKRMLLRGGPKLSSISPDAPFPRERTHWLERCWGAATAVRSPDRDAPCLSNLNSSLRSLLF